MMMAIWKFAPALAAGNTVVLKPSDTTPVSTLLLAEIAAEFLPPGVLQRDLRRSRHRPGPGQPPIPQMVSITGSVRAGTEVALAAAAGLKRVHLELGGKAPVVVFDDADVTRAAREIADGRLLQRRPGLHRGHPGAGRARRQPPTWPMRWLGRRAGAKAGGLDVPDADFGPLNNPAQLARVEGFLQRAPGSRHVLAGGHRVGDRGYCFAPTVVAGLRQDDEMIQEEIFGPVITVQQFG